MSVPSIRIVGSLIIASLLTFANTGYAQDTVPGALLIYPDSEDSSNPRVPCIPPVGTPDAREMAVDAGFTYTLSPFVQFAGGGQLNVKIRDRGRAKAVQVLSLQSGNAQLALRVEGIAKGKVASLAYLVADKDVVSGSTAVAVPASWTNFQIQWTVTEAILTGPGGAKVTLSLPAPIVPRSLEIQISQITSLEMRGQGSFSLAWQDGYAAKVVPAPGSTATLLRPFGFDTYFISASPAKRDCPMLELLNAQDQPAEITVDFSLHGENTQASQRWTQTVKAPSRSSAMVPIAFPTALLTDIYHLEIHSPQAQPAFAQAKHFAFVEPRPEPAGSAKFGLHDSNRSTFGFWPDALPITICHAYARWAYIQGPAWQGNSGVTPETPPGQWNWNPAIDWAIGQGLVPYVCLISVPYADWMREREYPGGRMKKYPWGYMGGSPKLDLYRHFVESTMAHYQGRVNLYEVENEPNSHLGGIPPEDYLSILKVVSEEARALDHAIRVFGICGTSDFVPWMKKVFDLGGASLMQGVSIHTYVTPRLPEESGLPAKLAEAQAAIAATGQPLALVNSETGTYVALREEVGHPIPPDRLAELIKQGVPNLAVPRGWPNHAVDEWQGSISIVRDAIYNFLGGVQSFTFFGWNDKWPPADWWTETVTASGSACFAMISASKDGERTPSLYTLSIGVLSEQLRSTILAKATKIDENGVCGGIFPKETGGEVAILWSPLGKRSVLIEAPDPAVEVVSLFGQKMPVRLSLDGNTGFFRLELGEQPVYLHSKVAGLRLLPSPVVNVVPIASRGQTSGFKFTIVNKTAGLWKGAVEYPKTAGWKFTPASQAFDLAPGQRATLEVACATTANVPRGSYPLDATTTLPNGAAFNFPLVAEVRPSVPVAVVPATFAWDRPASWAALSTPPLKVDQAEQVVIGRPPALSSLQEERFWKGPAELSGEARLAGNADTLFLFVKVRDENFALPAAWPDVRGSSLEFFLDTRTAQDGLGRAVYSKGVHQLLIRPIGEGRTTVDVSQAADKSIPLTGVAAAGSPVAGGSYWIALKIPWFSLGVKPIAGLTFGFDLGINGPPSGAKGRKTQLMLFGTASNSTDASAFGMAGISADSEKVPPTP